MKKKIFLALIGVLVIAGILAGIKALQISRMVDQSHSSARRRSR